MIAEPLGWIAGLVALNLLALLGALRLALGRERVARTPPVDATSAPPCLPEDDERGRALRELVGEIDRIEATRVADQRGESRLAADLGRWRGKISPAPAIPGRFGSKPEAVRRSK